MSAVVQLFPNNRQDSSVTEVRVADCDDGYTRIANELIDELLAADLTVRQMKVALAVIRKTYGFNKKHDRITNTQIASMTGIHFTHISTVKNELLDKHVLVMTGREIGLNKVISEWEINISQNSKTLAKSANKSLAKSANQGLPSQLNTKDTSQKTIKTKNKNISAEPSCDDSTLVDENQIEKYLPAEKPAEPESPTVIELPLNTGKQYQVTQAFVDEMASLYPAVDVNQELRTMRGWLLTNQAKRKTSKGIGRFINSWLSRCQDKGGSSGMVQNYQPRESKADAWDAAFKDTSWANDLGDY